MIGRPFAAALAVALIPCAASAQDSFEWSFGGVLASDYITDGESASGGPVIQGYVDVERGLFFGGLWASSHEAEVDLTLGIQPSFGEVDVALSYTYSLGDEFGDCCGDLSLYADHDISDTIYAGTGISYDPDSDELWLEVTSAVDLDDAWSVSGAVGADFGTSDDEDGDIVSWDLGVARQFNDTVYGDLRYYDSTIGSPKLVVAIGVDF